MSGVCMQGASGLASTWGDAARVLGLLPVLRLLEDHATVLADEMLGGAVVRVAKATHQGLPVLVPELPGGQRAISLFAPGEGVDSGVTVSPLLAGLAITAQAAEYLYFGADHRFPVSQKVRAFKYLLQAEAMRAAAEVLEPWQAHDYELVLGLDW